MWRVLSLSLVFELICYFMAGRAVAQTSNGTSNGTAGPNSAERAINLAESGHCIEALPLLKKTIRQTTNKELQKRAGLVGMHCAMTHNAPYDSLSFLEVLTHEFPRDPEVLYSATHAFSDLSLMTSQQLAREAPFSYQVHLLNAEALELQGKWPEAVTEYKRILDINPLLAGIHARLGRALLSEPQPTPESVAQAKKAFEDELEIDPRNASAEYVLGELAKNDNDLSAATRHYARATVAEAYLGLGTSLVSSKRFADAIPPLEKYEKLAPDSPTGHFQLALAYSGVGRKDDANREAALQRETAASLEKVRRRVAEGLLEKQDSQGEPQSSDQPK
jgi:tetratricopeptide (TPR) repeat protein